VRALLCRPGGPLSAIRVGELPPPSPGDGELLIKVQAAALNAVDVKIAAGQRAPLHDPPVLGVDATGVVTDVGAGVTRFEPGDVVLTSTLTSGAIAEFALARDDARITHRPAGLAVDEAAALPTAALTATRMIELAEIRPGETALVIGASGGVGTFLVQLAQIAGARVVATGHAGDAQLLRQLGADTVVDYRGERLPTRVDVVLDVVNSGDALVTVGQAVRPGGRLVSALGGRERVRDDLPIRFPTGPAREGDLQCLAKRAAAGELRVAIGSRHALDDAVAATFEFALDHTQGKRVIEIA
jgi:NADPH2:quinone reductase